MALLDRKGDDRAYQEWRASARPRLVKMRLEER